MSTRATMEAEIAGDLGRSDLTAYITTKIEAAIDLHKKHRFWFNDSRSMTITTVAGTTEYTPSDEIIELDEVSIIDGTNNHVLDYVTYINLADSLRSNTSQTRPYSYTRYAKKVILYPPPDAVYTVNLDGLFGAVKPATDTEANNVWMVEAYALIMHTAKRMIYQSRIRNPGLAQADGMAEKEALDDLWVKTSKRRSSGCIEGTPF